MPSSTLLHVAYPKSASTWLQASLFSAPPFRSVASLAEIRETLIHPHPLEFSEKEARALLRPRAGDVDAEGLRPVLSDELLGGEPVAGGYDCTVLAERLKAVFPEARVLVVVREQGSMIRSLYGEFLKKYGRGTIEQFLHPKPPVHHGTLRATWAPRLRRVYFEYDRLVALYDRLFGTDDVLVMPYEHLVLDPQSYVRTIAEHAGASMGEHLPDFGTVRPSVRGLALRSLGTVNRVGGRAGSVRRKAREAIRDLLFAVDGAVPDSVDRRLRRPVVDAVDSFVGDHFLESNRRLQERMGLDLGSLGYAV